MNALISFVRRHRFLGLLALLFVGAFIAFRIFLNAETQTIYTAKLNDLTSTVFITGTYVTAAQTKVTSPTNGIITELYVANNDRVAKGDKLFYVESSATEIQKREALSSYLAAKSILDADMAKLYSLQSTMYAAWKKYTDIATNSTYEEDNGKPKTENRVLTEFTTVQDDWLAAEANYKNQQGVIAKDQAAASAAKQAYDETQNVTVEAPIAGTVINLASKINDQVTASAPSRDGAPVLIIADYTNPTLVSAVDQVHVPQLKVGQTASIIFDALPSQTFKGTVSYIDSAGTKSSGATSFNVFVTVNDFPPEIKLNMTASITIETARKDKVLTIPNSTLVQKNGKTYVQMANKSLREVRVGLKGLTDAEILSGLSVGDRILEQP